MSDYNVMVSETAMEQLKQLSEYITFELQAPSVAENLLTELETSMATLDTFPNRIPLGRESICRKYGLHVMVVKNYLIYFSINDSLQTVHILAVLYGKSNQAEFLKSLL